MNTECLALMKLVNEALGEGDEDLTLRLFLEGGHEMRITPTIPREGYTAKHALLQGERWNSAGPTDCDFAVPWVRIIALEVEF